MVDQEFYNVTVQSAGARFYSWSHTPWFDVESFKEKTIRTFLSICIDKIEEAFSISDQLKGFTSIDTATFPKETKDLTDFGEEGVISLADFSSRKLKLNSVVIPSLVSKDNLPVQYKVFNKKQYQLILSYFWNKSKIQRNYQSQYQANES